MSEWKVPGYTELKPLGQGGFGSVMLARHDATGTAVAIKYLLPKLRQDPDFSALFRAEAEALGALDDPYVVRLYEYVESAAGAAIVMELVDGVTLWDIIAQHGRTTPESALVVLYGSLLGLAAAHARGVVHRDFKPRNVLIGPSGVSKLTDFGIAARAGAATVPSGSVAYAPPEQFDGGPASPASDVYAATATFYECLAGRPPFTGTTVEAVIWQHHSAEVSMDPVPPPLQPIVARGLAKGPQYRPADAAALAAELRATAISAYGPDWEQRGRWYLGEAALALAALWPSAGVPALHATSAAQVQLVPRCRSKPMAPRRPTTRRPRPDCIAGIAPCPAPAALAALRAATAARTTPRAAQSPHVAALVTTGAVVAAAVTVAATSRPPSGPAAAHPAAPPTGRPRPRPPGRRPSPARSGRGEHTGKASRIYGCRRTGGRDSGVTGATAGEVARLYAQPFPFTSPPVPVQRTLRPIAGGSATISRSPRRRHPLPGKAAPKRHRDDAAGRSARSETLYVVGYAKSSANRRVLRLHEPRLPGYRVPCRRHHHLFPAVGPPGGDGQAKVRVRRPGSPEARLSPTSLRLDPNRSSPHPAHRG